MRGGDDWVALTGSRDYENATDSTHAIDLVQANLIQLLSAIGRESVDFFFLPVRRTVEEFQIAGALEALESARQDGHIRFLGLQCVGSPFAALGVWQFHDAFEVVRMRRSQSDHEAYDTLSPLARERRVGVVTDQPFDAEHPSDAVADAVNQVRRLSADHPVIVPVSSAAAIRTFMGAVAP